MSRLAILAALAFALTGCLAVNPPSAHMGGAASDAGPGDAGLARIAVGSFCPQMAQVACTGYESCCPSHSIDMMACVSALTDVCNHGLGPILLDARTGYSETVAAQVIAEGQALVATCDPGIVAWYSSRAGLQRVMQGTIAGGDSCTTRADDGAAYFSCMNLEQGCIGSGTSFHCTARVPTGMTCHTDADCVEGDYCQGAVAGSNPILGLPGHCALREAIGHACTTDSACETYLCDTTTAHQCAALNSMNAYCGFH